MINEKVKNKINKEIKSIIYIWTLPVEDDVPLKFSDNLAVGFFCGTLANSFEYFYKLGIKHEKLRRKHKAVKKYKSAKVTNFDNR